MSEKEEKGGSVPVATPVYDAELMDDAVEETRSVAETEPPSPQNRLSYRVGKIVGSLISFAEGVAAITGVINRNIIKNPGSHLADENDDDTSGNCHGNRRKRDGRGRGQNRGPGRGKGKTITRTMLKRNRMN